VERETLAQLCLCYRAQRPASKTFFYLIKGAHMQYSGKVCVMKNVV
jgi:hypothetical protein